MRVRSGLVTAIYKKALILSNDGRSSASGDIVNLMSVDAARLQDFCTYGLISISGPFQVCDHLLRPAFSVHLPVDVDHPGIRLSVQHPWLACICWSSDHDCVYSLEHVHRSHPQEAPREADEEP